MQRFLKPRRCIVLRVCAGLTFSLCSGSLNRQSTGQKFAATPLFA